MHEETDISPKNKWYLLNPEFVLENKANKFLWCSEVQIVHLITARRPDIMIINKTEKLVNSVLFHPGGPQSKNKRKQKRDKNFDVARELNKIMEREGKVITVLIGAF